MKYSIKELLDHNDIMCHVFLTTLADNKELLNKLAVEKNALPEKDQGKKDYSIELLIDGESLNPRKFFEKFSDQYQDMVKKAALELLRDKMNGFMEKVDSVNTILESWAEDVNWDIENPFIKDKKN